MFLCHNCRQEVSLEVKIGRRDTCPNCYADLHCCLNCRFYDPGRQNQCMEPHSGFVSDRAAGNFCHAFEFRDSREADEAEVQNAKARLEALFRKLR